LSRILLDTNAFVAAARGDSVAVDILSSADEIHLNATVLGELLAGFAVGSREAANRERLGDFLDSPRVSFLPLTKRTCEFYALLYAQLRRKGRPIPTNDLWIAATALEHGLALFTLDEHFGAVDGLRLTRTAADLEL
jgi:predicted nucleic acid-binding protein